MDVYGIIRLLQNSPYLPYGQTNANASQKSPNFWEITRVLYAFIYYERKSGG